MNYCVDRLRRFENHAPVGVIVIPTAETDADDISVPDSSGKARIKAALAERSVFPSAKLLVCGDYPDCQSVPLWMKYRDYIITIADIHPEYGGGHGNNTVHDLVSMKNVFTDLRDLQGCQVVAIASDWQHVCRIAPLFYKMNFRVKLLEAEPCSRSKVIEFAMALVSFLDPDWGSMAAELLAKKANKNAEAYCEKTRKIINPKAAP